MLFNFLINLFLSSIRINIVPYFVLQIFGFTCRTSPRIHLQILFQPTLIRAVPNNRSAHRRTSNVNACFFRTMSELIFLLCALKKLHTHPIFSIVLLRDWRIYITALRFQELMHANLFHRFFNRQTIVKIIEDSAFSSKSLEKS